MISIGQEYRYLIFFFVYLFECLSIYHYRKLISSCLVVKLEYVYTKRVGTSAATSFGAQLQVIVARIYMPTEFMTMFIMFAMSDRYIYIVSIIGGIIITPNVWEIVSCFCQSHCLYGIWLKMPNKIAT